MLWSTWARVPQPLSLSSRACAAHQETPLTEGCALHSEGSPTPGSQRNPHAAAKTPRHQVEIHLFQEKRKKQEKEPRGFQRISSSNPSCFRWEKGAPAVKRLYSVIGSVQSLSCVRLTATPWTAAHQASLSIANSWSLLKLNVHRVGDAIQPSYPLSSLSLLAFNLSQHQSLFRWVCSLHQVAKVLFQLQHQFFQWIFRTDSFQIDWFYLLAVHGVLKSLLQHHSSKESILQALSFL